MIFHLPGLLDSDDLATIRAEISAAPFVDGMQTAGPDAAHIKHNSGIAVTSNAHQTLGHIVKEKLLACDDFKHITQLRNISSITFSRYDQGMHYGDHSDFAFMRDGTMRSDLSFTLFLSDPSDYEGGELVLNTDVRPESYKLQAGDLIVYPTLLLHRVEPVRSGTRFVAVGWVESWIRDPLRRQILLDLTQSLGALKRASGPNQETLQREFVRLDKVYQNLMRMWAMD